MPHSPSEAGCDRYLPRRCPTRRTIIRATPDPAVGRYFPWFQRSFISTRARLYAAGHVFVRRFLEVPDRPASRRIRRVRSADLVPRREDEWGERDDEVGRSEREQRRAGA